MTKPPPVIQPDHRPVLAVGLGRGFGGKSTGLAEMVWRAQAAKRDVLVADGDALSSTLSTLFSGAMKPPTAELPDVKEWMSKVLNAVARGRSAVLDLGGGDRVLQEYGRDLRLIEFCAHRRIDPVAVYFLGPEEEDLRHVVSIWEAEYFRPERSILMLNEGVIRTGQTVHGAFERTMKDPAFIAMVQKGARPVLMTKLACMDAVRKAGLGFYDVASDDKIDLVEQFMVEDWLATLEHARTEAGVAGWLP